MKSTYCQGKKFMLVLLFGNFDNSLSICADKNKTLPIFDYGHKKIEHYFL